MQYYSIKYADRLNGRSFEKFTRNFLQALGYRNVKATKASGDYGIDVLFFDTHKRKVGIQCKHFANHQHKTGYRAVEETASGINCYHLDKGIVLTNAQFSPEAINGAKANHIKLWNRNTLDYLLRKTEYEKIYPSFKSKIRYREKKSFTTKRFKKPKKYIKKIKFPKQPKYLITLFSSLILNLKRFIRKHPIQKDNHYIYLKNTYCVHYYLKNRNRRRNIKKLSPKLKAWHLKSCLKLMNSIYLFYKSPTTNEHLVNSIAGSFGIMKKNNLLPSSAKYGHDINNQVNLEHVAYLANISLAREVNKSEIPIHRKLVRKILTSKHLNLNRPKRHQIKLNNVFNFIDNEANTRELKQIKKRLTKKLRKEH